MPTISTLPTVMFVRVGRRPILLPRTTVSWEAGGVFAPAVIAAGDEYRMIYRAFGRDRVSRLGYAVSSDGLHWQRFGQPVLAPEVKPELDGIEDPRITFLSGHYYVVATAARRRTYGKQQRWSTRVHLYRTEDFRHFERLIPNLPPKNNKDGALFPEKINGRYYLLHRILPKVWISSSEDLVNWEGHRPVFGPLGSDWESIKVGTGSPPIKTELGWLVFYHGVSEAARYSMGAIILDLDHPWRPVYRLPYPLLEPVRTYENQGVVPRVVFGTSVVDRGADYWLYYGAADRAVGVAAINKAALLEELRGHPVP